MKTRIFVALGVIAVAVMLVVSFAPAVWAQGPGSGAGMGQAQGRGRGNGQGMGQARGGKGNPMGGAEQSLVGVAAQQLSMERTDLVAQLQGGKTIADVAKEKNVALDTIVNAFVATRQERLAQAVANGAMTQAEADGRLAAARATSTARLSQPWSPQQGVGSGHGSSGGNCDNAGNGPMRNH